MNYERLLRSLGRSLMTAGVYRIMRKMGTPAVIGLAVVGAVLYAVR